jgi:hypothetical protein
MAEPRSASLLSNTVDPVTLEIIRGGLRAIQSEMEVLIERTAMSPFIREKNDYASGLYAADIGGMRPGSLSGGALLEGPAIVKQLDATTMLLPGQTANVHKFGSLIVREI